MTNYISSAYGYLVGTVSKVVYPISYFGYIFLVITAKFVVLNCVISLPIKYFHGYESTQSLWNKATVLFNINTEFDAIKHASLWMAIGATFFGGKFNAIHAEGMKYAQQIERYVEEEIFCFSGVLCKGDQYGLFDQIYDVVDFLGATNDDHHEKFFHGLDDT